MADVVSQPGASFMYREANERYIPITFSVRGRDLPSTIADADARIRQLVQLPAGYRVAWAGEFQQAQDALDRLRVVVPFTLALIANRAAGTVPARASVRGGSRLPAERRDRAR